jgi:hypothetical protein
MNSVRPDRSLPGQQFGQQQQIMTMTMATIKMIPTGMVMPMIVPADKVTGVSEIRRLFGSESSSKNSKQGLRKHSQFYKKY